MANLKISQLPEYSGNTSGSYLVMNNSGETITYKVKKENYIFPYNGDATITGSLNLKGGTGIEPTTLNIETNFSNASGIYFNTGSTNLANLRYTNSSNILLLSQSGSNKIWIGNPSGSNTLFGNTTISGSLTVSGSALYDIGVTGSMRLQNGTNTTGIYLETSPSTATITILSGACLTSTNPNKIELRNDLDIMRLISNGTSGSIMQLISDDNTLTTRTIIELPCSSSWNGGLTKFKYPVEITGSLRVTGSGVSLIGTQIYGVIDNFSKSISIITSSLAGDTVGFTFGNSNYGNNWINKPSIFTYNNSTSLAKALIGFQSTDSYTDNTVTILAPLEVSGSLTISGSINTTSPVSSSLYSEKTYFVPNTTLINEDSSSVILLSSVPTSSLLTQELSVYITKVPTNEVAFYQLINLMNKNTNTLNTQPLYIVNGGDAGATTLAISSSIVSGNLNTYGWWYDFNTGSAVTASFNAYVSNTKSFKY